MADDFPDFVKFEGFAGQAWYHQHMREKRILRRAREFTPERLLEKGEQGVWYDPSDTTTLFQDSAGTTPVTASGQPVGRMLDKSGRGNHATQPTAGSRPIYRRGDSMGVVNLLTWSEAFDNAAWVKTVSITPFGQLGSAPAFKLARTNTTSSQGAQQAILSLVSGQAYTARVLARKGAIGELLGLRIQGAYPRRADAVFNLTTGVVALSTVSGGWSNPTATITEVSTGVYECTLSAVPDVTQGGFVLTGPTTFANNSWEAATPSLVEVVITKAQLNLGPTALPYQRNDSRLGGVATGASTDLHWLETDGVDDGMVTGNIDFTGTDKVAVFAGVRKLSDATRPSAAFELSSSASINPNVFGLDAPGGAAAEGYSFRSKGTTSAFAVPTLDTYPAPITNVLAGIGNISGDQAILRVNGAQAAISTADQGTGNFGKYPLYLFRRAGTSLPFNGWFYGLAITGRLTTDAETVATERFLAAKSGVVIP